MTIDEAISYCLEASKKEEQESKNMYVSIHNVQRVCAMTGGAADTDEGECIAEVIRNNLERMVETRNKESLVVYKEEDENGI